MTLDTVDKCSVYFELKDIQGNGLNMSAVVTLSQKMVQYKNATLMFNSFVAFPSVNGLFQFDLIETDNMEPGVYYIIKVGSKTYQKTVPFAAEACLFDLPDAVIP